MRADTLKTQVIFARSSKTETKNTTACLYAADKSKFTDVMFPDSSFIAELEKLGFSDNTGVTNVEVKDWNRFQHIAIISVIPDIVKAGYWGYQYGEYTGNILVIPDISARGKKRQAPFF
jgi:hypothetical protein